MIWLSEFIRFVVDEPALYPCVASRPVPVSVVMNSKHRRPCAASAARGSARGVAAIRGYPIRGYRLSEAIIAGG
jgi:hypothetical protein